MATDFQRIRRLDEEEAKKTLGPEEFETWKDLQGLREQAEENNEQIKEDERTAVDTLVKADMGSLTKELDLFGNTVLVAINLDRKQQQLVSSIDRKFDEIDLDSGDIDSEQMSSVESVLAEFFARTFLEFEGVNFKELSDEQAEEIALKCVQKWGLRGSFHAAVEIIKSTKEQDAELMEAVEKFRT